MNKYIFLTDEGYTYQPNTESIEPDIENLQVIGISKGANPREAFRNLISKRKYLLETTFEDIFCYRLHDNYESTYTEFNIKEDFKNCNEDLELIKSVEVHIGLEPEEAAKAFDAIIGIVKSDINLVKEIICEEKFCNYYEDIENYYELSAALVNDDILWEVDEQDEFYDFLLECQDEEELKEALVNGGWFVSNGFDICLDDEIAKMINVSYRE